MFYRPPRLAILILLVILAAAGFSSGPAMAAIEDGKTCWKVSQGLKTGTISITTFPPGTAMGRPC